MQIEVDDQGTHDVTRLLGEIAEGKDAARDELARAAYEQWRKIAQVRMKAERPGQRYGEQVYC